MIAMDSFGTKGLQCSIAALALLTTPSVASTVNRTAEGPDTTCICVKNNVTTDINTIVAGKTNKLFVIPQKKNYAELYRKFAKSTIYQKIYYGKSLGDVITIEE